MNMWITNVDPALPKLDMSPFLFIFSANHSAEIPKDPRQKKA